MELTRTSGVLLHPVSLPGRFGIGDLGDAAYRWVDFLAETGQTLWQLLPLGCTGEDYGNSPYQSLSAMAGSPLLISPERLAAQHWLTPADLEKVPTFPEQAVDYSAVTAYKMPLLRRSFARFRDSAGAAERAAFRAFLEKSAEWLDDFALFMALKQAHDGRPWNTWEPALRTRQPEALARARNELADAVEEQQYLQYQFSTQWSALKEYANARNIRII